jgi:hypothetical protein
MGIGRVPTWMALTSLLSVVAACGGGDEEGTSVQDFMESAGQVEAIAVSDIYDRDVSEVVIACAYTGLTAITDELGFDWPGATSLANQLDASLDRLVGRHDIPGGAHRVSRT